MPGWWFQPIWKMLVKLEIFPNFRVKIKNLWFFTTQNNPGVLDHCWFTPLKTNISTEKWWLEDVFPIEKVPFFWGHVNFQGCNDPKKIPTNHWVHQADRFARWSSLFSTVGSWVSFAWPRRCLEKSDPQNMLPKKGWWKNGNRHCMGIESRKTKETHPSLRIPKNPQQSQRIPNNP